MPPGPVAWGPARTATQDGVAGYMLLFLDGEHFVSTEVLSAAEHKGRDELAGPGR